MSLAISAIRRASHHHHHTTRKVPSARSPPSSRTLCIHKVMRCMVFLHLPVKLSPQLWCEAVPGLVSWVLSSLHPFEGKEMDILEQDLNQRDIIYQHEVILHTRLCVMSFH